jgi:5-(carboxyamino)imidazole ribonucleotide mutase
MMKPVVIILMGSKADEGHCQKIAEAVKQFGIETILRIGSAHKTAEHTFQLLKQYEDEGRPRVYITVAGRSNALSGFTDGAVSAPVIACPPPSEAYGGADVFSSIRMPSGIAPAYISEPLNAALLAAKILGLSDQELKERVLAFQSAQMEKILRDDQEMQK